MRHYFQRVNRPYDAILNMRIQPISADNNKTFQLDGVDQWLMMGDVAFLEFIFVDLNTKEEESLWEYSAP